MILRGTKALREFQYSYINLNHRGRNAKWEPGAILRSLVFYAGHSLVLLDLTGDDGSWDICLSDSPYFDPYTRRFKVLKQLFVQEGMFIEDVADPGHPLSLYKPRTLTRKSARRNHRMVDLLPASLEELTLFPSLAITTRIPTIFDGFLELKAARLPRLNEITLAYGLQLREGMKRACKKVGTTVISKPKPVPE